MTRFTIIFLMHTILSCDTSKTSDNRIVEIGRSIISFDASRNERLNVPDLVYIGDHLIEKVLFLKGRSKHYSFKVDRGDLKKPLGDGTADYILRIKTDFEESGIRLNYDRRLDKYHILGWAAIHLQSTLGQNGSLHQLYVRLDD